MKLGPVVRGNLTRHWLRTLLTLGSLMVALFLLCTLRSLVTTLEAGTQSANSRRLWVQSAVSLFVDLPLSYVPRIEQVEGVTETCRWQWFGGYYQDPGNFFAQFAVDARELLDLYPEMELVQGDAESWLGNRRGCVVGEGLARQFGWEVGQPIPILGQIFPHPDGPDTAWVFELSGIYRPTKPTLDDRTLYFHWELFEETLDASPAGIPGVGVILVQIEEGADPTPVMAAIDGLYENGPQRVQTTTEAEFNAQFVSMYGNVPFFVTAIGGAVLAAILLACVNTMLMAAREQRRDVGILKALGFPDRSVGLALLSQSLLIAVLGGGAGIGMALAAQKPLAMVTGTMIPGYRVAESTVGLAIAVTLGIGLLAGLVPALQARGLKVVDALGERA